MANFADKHKRDFRLCNNTNTPNMDFNKIAVGNKVLRDDVTAILNSLSTKLSGFRKYTKEDIQRALDNHNLRELRIISRYFYDCGGIYKSLCLYMAHLYKYDWFITPHVFNKNVKDTKVIEGWYKSATYLENSRLKYIFGRIATQVIYEGAYYGYRLDQKAATFLQPLPVDYCRARYENNGRPAVEFNIKYFDDTISDAQYRARVLKMFPPEFQKAYVSYKKGTLPQDFAGDSKGWFLLDPKKAVKFNLNNDDAPLFAGVIPSLLDLEEAQEIDRNKMRQQLLRLIIQKMPIDKNGDLIFDVAEAQQLHSNAVGMVNGVIGTKVLTTFADVSVADLSDRGNVSSVDQLEKIERSVYNASGISQMQFNTEKNAALAYSTANNGAVMTDLLLQFEDYAESLLEIYNKNPKWLMYKVQILPTTVHNYEKLAETYKAQTMIGFSKLLPQVALGQTQSSIIATAVFENDTLNLDELFIAPQMSSTISSNKATDDSKGQTTKLPSSNKGGRPEKDDAEKSEKTIANRESGGQ